MLQDTSFSLRANFHFALFILILVCATATTSNAQWVTRTIFPATMYDRFGCIYFRATPIEHKVYYEPATGGGSRVLRAIFNGGIPVGRNGRYCRGVYGYATFQDDSRTYNLSNRITITFPAPIHFENIFVEGERGKVLNVILNGATSKQITLEPNFAGEQGTYGKYSLFDYEFPPNATLSVSSITIESPDPRWKFSVQSVSYYDHSVATGGGDPPGNPNNPVVFVPGIAGSGLSLQQTGERRWLPTITPINLCDLTLQGAHDGPCGDYSPKEVKVDDAIRTQTIVENPVVTFEVYTTLINTMTATGGYREYDFANNPANRTLAGCLQRRASYPSNLPTPTLFVFAYDWRKSNFENVQALKEYVQCAALFNPGKKVNIVAHSMGGLLSRNYILQNPDDNNVDKLITIASPWLGTPRGFHSLQTGSFMNRAFDGFAPQDFLFGTVLRDLIEFFPGAHELLPGQNYFNGLYPQTPITIKQPWSSETPLSYYSARTWINDNHPVSRPASNGEVFHGYFNSQRQGQDIWQNDQTGVQYFHIYGQQFTNKTVGKVRIETGVICLPLQTQCISGTRYRPYPTWGDATVSLESTKRIFGGNKDFNYKPHDNDNPYRFVEKLTEGEDEELAEHNGLTKNSRVLKRVIKILQPGYLVSQDAMTKADCANGVTEPSPCPASNLTKTETPSDLGGVSNYVSMYNVGNFSITNQSIDFVGFSEENGIEKLPIGENSAWLAIPGSGALRKITFTARGGAVEFEIIRGVDYDHIEQLTVFKDLNLLAGKKVELIVYPWGNATVLYYANGNTQSPTTISPTLVVTGTSAKDINAPILSYNYQASGSGKIITLTATDDLSGVRQIRYSLDGQNFSAYTSPFAVGAAQTTVYAFAEDNNRNRTGIAAFDVSGNSYSIGNRVWFDTNNDGKINFDEGFGEQGTAGVSLSLFADNNSDGQPDDLDSPLASTVSSAEGYYRFDNLSVGVIWCASTLQTLPTAEFWQVIEIRREVQFLIWIRTMRTAAKTASNRWAKRTQFRTSAFLAIRFRRIKA